MFKPANRTYGILGITKDDIARDLELEVDESYLVLAKHDVMGTPEETLCQILDVDSATIRAWKDDSEYKAVRGYVAGRYANSMAIQSAGWDEIESLGIQGMVEILKTNKDPDVLLKAAAVANRATRRTKNQNETLDPSKTGNQTVITVTSRMIDAIVNHNRVTAQTVEASITSGQLVTPSLKELDSVLQIEQAPRPKGGSIYGADPMDSDDLLSQLSQKIEDEGR